MNRIALLISFYNESDIVKQTIEAFRKYSDDGVVICVQSKYNCDGDNISYIKSYSDVFVELPDLSLVVHKYEIGKAVCRNYSRAFTEFRKLNLDVDYIICILGDTLIYDFNKLMTYLKDKMKNKKAGVLQAIGQNFHSGDADPINGRCGGRLQTENITDIMPQFFALKGDICGFTEIKNTNRWTSEENIGNELALRIDFKTQSVRLNTDSRNAYDFNSGLKLQIKGWHHT